MNPREYRVLVLTNLWPHAEDPSYGAFVASQVASLEKLGFECVVDFVNGRRTNLSYLRGACRMLALNVQPRRYDLVHAHTGHCGVLARLQVRYPIVVSYVGYDLYGKVKSDGSITAKSRLEAVLFRNLARVVPATITKSKAMETLLPRSTRGRNSVLPNGVDRDVFKPKGQAAARLQLGWPRDGLVALFAGRPDVERKRFGVARRACELAGASLGGLTLRVCEGLPHAEVPLWMNAADVLVLPSLAEGSPNVVKEALACDLPVVATAVGDVVELLEGVVPSKVVTPGAAVEEVADALVEVIGGGPKRSNGRARTERLGADVIAARLEEIYDATVRGRRIARSEREAENAAPV